MNSEELQNSIENPEDEFAQAIGEEIREDGNQETETKADEPYEEEKAKNNKKPKGNLIFGILTLSFCLIIFGVGAANFIAEDRVYSETENRVLAQMPELSLFSLTEGTFMRDFETYLADQFIFRDEIITAKTFLDRMIGKNQVGGVYIGKEGYLFSKQTDFSEERAVEITDALSFFGEKNKTSKITFMLSPNSSFVNSDILPEHLSLHDQSYQIEELRNYTESEAVEFINLSETFKAQDNRKNLFYKTDHHWTTRGAYLAFNTLMNSWQKNTAETEFDFYTVADDFQGTLSSKAGVLSSADTVEICVPKNAELTYTVTYNSQEKKTTTFFDESKLGTKNKYEVFLGGNFDKITIDTTSSTKDTLLIIKDSYANCMIPMLTPFFAKIVMVDPRYLTESLSAIIEENGFTHILLLYNLNTLLEDTSLADCLKG